MAGTQSAKDRVIRVSKPRQKKLKTVAAVKYVHTEDIDRTPGKTGGGDAWEGLVNACANAAMNALETPPQGFSQYQRNSLTDIFSSMKATHRAIRLLVKLGDGKPESVDALVLARLQLEGLYTTCLLVESPENVDRFTHEAWKRQYIRWLLNRDETENLSIFSAPNAADRARLETLAGIWRVTNEQRLTIEFHEGNVKPPAEFKSRPIANFPTPGGVIDEIPDGPKSRMLLRLYPEYQDLCAFAHGRPVAGFQKSIFDERSPLRNEFIAMHGEAYLHDSFQEKILAPAQMFSLLSVAQSAAELIAIYPGDVDLRAVVTRAWTELNGLHLLLNAIWKIRTKDLLGIIG